MGSPISLFQNRRAAPDRLTPGELKAEIIARITSPLIHPRFAELARLACTNTAYVHMVRKCEAIRPWASPNVTLLGDAVFNMSNMLGKGANCALLDAVSLAETISSPTYNRRSPTRLAKYVTENIERRQRERHRSALMQKIVFFGQNKLKDYVRNKALPFALKRIDVLDQEEHDPAGGDWVVDEGAWRESTGEAWAEELKWEELYDAEHDGERSTHSRESKASRESKSSRETREGTGSRSHSRQTVPSAEGKQKRRGVVGDEELRDRFLNIHT